MQTKSQAIEVPLRSLEEMCLFLVASAEGLFEEPKGYGPLRLLQAVVRIGRLVEAKGSPDRFLEEVVRDIDHNVVSLLEDPPGFEQFVSRLVVDFSQHLIQEE